MLLEDQMEIWAVRWKLAHKFITQIAWQVYAIDIKHHLFVRVLWLLYKTLNIAHKLLLFMMCLELESPWSLSAITEWRKAAWTSPLVFHGRKKIIQIWYNMRVSKSWQNCHIQIPIPWNKMCYDLKQYSCTKENHLVIDDSKVWKKSSAV